MKYIPLLFLMFLVSCSSEPAYLEGATSWSSGNHPVKVKWSENYRMILPFVDMEERLLIGIINPESGSSIVVKISQDVPQSDIANKEFYVSNKEIIRHKVPSVEFLEEGDEKFMGKDFHFIQYKMFNENFKKKMDVNNYIRRDGEHMFSITYSYSSEEDLKDIKKILKDLSLWSKK